ncbi:GNAT family N-acetyltransferase [Vitiosangium sp. GDMCC 1.1324]|uniref:GNAT family N-acetyltransferase n=1 Tax=Vitiosangium sp. (strain GDMCC 1.1324) TaxID=2138576 RepID=UPI000D3CCF1A|nr:GNAT family N-acetyltransferase [Vitiosangium sp. GDMCC 1.1324]PTL79319.1 GNAT family N-acetyltransferase [Vitiosangium sp. GDMCC 1.1324]
MSIDEIHESNVRFHDSWRFFARNSVAGEVHDLPEVCVASSNVSWSMMNAAFLPAPVETEEVLERAAAAAARYFVPRRRGWMLALCEDWVPARLRERAGALFAPHGLKLTMVATGMVAERLAPPMRPLPLMDIRQTKDSRGRGDIADVNALCYDVPVPVGREAFDVPGLFAGDSKGFVGYRHGEAATSAAVIRVDDVAYIAMVATLPSHRKLGCAEAVMRHALAEAKQAWGIERTVLHATPVGLPVYRRMGYRPVTRFLFYMAAPQPGR